MADGNNLIGQFISSQGQILGLILNGFTLIPYNHGGIVMQDSSGALWLLQIGTDGRLSSAQVTF